MSSALVINSGSSSIKYQLFDDDDNQLLAGVIERVDNHNEAIKQLLETMKAKKSFIEPDVIGHRVVHGGERFSKPSLITKEVLEEITNLIPLAPLHNPGNIAGIEACLQAFPKTPQVAVFDTAFHQTMPASSYRYPINEAIAEQYGIRKYGFHGTSFSFVTEKTAEFLGKNKDEINLVILHLGNGASACAVKNGESFDTSMGLSPLAGLVMGTRSGDIDPAVVFYLNREAGMEISEIDHLLNSESGLRGMTGNSDMRDVMEASPNDPKASEALEVYRHRIVFYLSGFAGLLGELDAVVLTAGIGENSKQFREFLFEDNPLGIDLDKRLNDSSNAKARLISSETSKIPLLVVPTNEELEIARQSRMASF